VQADRVAHLQARLGVGWRSGRAGVGGRSGVRGGARRGGLLRPELRGLHRQRPARLGGHLLQRRAAACGHRRGHGPLHERRLAQHDTPAGLEHLDGELGAHERAAEVHEHKDAVVGPRALDRRAHPLGVGAQRARLVHPARGLERQLRAAHLARQRDDALGERLAVGDDNEADH